jgi:ribosomal protein S18 acetylase RimI-like enzyme
MAFLLADQTFWAEWPVEEGRQALDPTRNVTHDVHVTYDDIRVRRVVVGDAIELGQFYADLSAESRASRFHSASRGISHEQADHFASVDHRRRDGFVAVADRRIVGHLALEPIGPETDELAIAVDDRFQQHGVGTLLLAAGIASARLRGVRRIVALVKAENGPMQHLLTTSQHPLRLGWEGSQARYELEVLPEASGQAAA